MTSIIYIMISVGSLLMIWNIRNYLVLIRSMRDVLSSGDRSMRFKKRLGLALLCFFLTGYLLVLIFCDKNQLALLIAGILFGGSIFVWTLLSITIKITNLVKERSIDVAEVLISVVDARDSNLKGHSGHVQRLTMLLYDHLPNNNKRTINPISLEYAALFHDIGKLGIPESILNKPAKLTDEEWITMRNHPKIGARILRNLSSFRNILPWIEYHHERVDGNGYYKIKPDDIPFASRIIAVADTFSAITMKRSYKPSKTYEEAIDIIKSVAGTQLHQEMVALFCDIPKDEVMACMPKQEKESSRLANSKIS